MNALLFAAHEVDRDGNAWLPAGDRRCQHLRTVLQVRTGQALCAGMLGGPLGIARPTAIGSEGVALACRFDRPAPPARDVLVLAIPRPKVLLRCVENAAALGFGRILLVRTWRTDRSHVEASALAADALHARAILGLEQAQRTQVPDITTFPLFKPFVEDELDARCGATTRVVADPGAARSLAALGALPDRPVALAIGPERGFTAYELDLLAAHGFAAAHAGPHPLRVETALAFVFGQLMLLRSPPR